LGEFEDDDEDEDEDDDGNEGDDQNDFFKRTWKTASVSRKPCCPRMPVEVLAMAGIKR
jgi:hypothetical protein